MPSSLPAGPFRRHRTREGVEFPYYVIPFDKHGNCEGPQTRDHLMANAKGHSDIFIFSHGWNNDWTAVTDRYAKFIEGLAALRAEHNLAAPDPFKPLLVGIFWPSQALTWFESESGPDIAALSPAGQDAAVSDTLDVFRDVAADLPDGDRSRFWSLAGEDRLEPAQAEELAAMLAAVLGGDQEASLGGPSTAGDLTAAGAALTEEEPDYDAVGTAGGTAADPEAAGGGILKKLDPRNIVKPFTVLQMKDRAGRVGAYGVAPLLTELLQATSAGSGTEASRVHLLGHSYGCKVVMTALCTPAKLARKVASAMLFQPAVSQYAFAAQVPGTNAAGGFYSGLSRVEMPVMTTFSAHDMPLRKLFHIACRRSEDLGELQMAAEGTPSKYAAMGGYGPLDSNASIIPIQDPPKPYGLSGPGRIIGLDGTSRISGHGNIDNDASWWAMYQLCIGPWAGG